MSYSMKSENDLWMSKVRVPKVGDTIIYEEPSFDRVTEGVVTLLLSAQFMIKTESGSRRHIMYNESWKKKPDSKDGEITQQAKKKRKAKKPI